MRACIADLDSCELYETFLDGEKTAPCITHQEELVECIKQNDGF